MSEDNGEKNIFVFKKPLDIASFVVNRLVDKLEGDSIKRRAPVSGITLYRKNKIVFDKLFSLQERYGIDMCGYVSYFMRENKSMTGNKISLLLDSIALCRYADSLKIRVKHVKIIDSFSKSVRFMISEMKRRSCVSVLECLSQLFKENKIAQFYLTGKLSSHYLAGIKNFRRLVNKMDGISKDTLIEVANQQEQLLSDLRDSFIDVKNISVVSSVAYTEQQRKLQ